MITTNLFENLEKNDRAIMEKFSAWLAENKNSSEVVCSFLANKIGDKELANDFKGLSDETKMQACLEYLAIGLTAGSVKRKEVESFFAK